MMKPFKLLLTFALLWVGQCAWGAIARVQTTKLASPRVAGDGAGNMTTPTFGSNTTTGNTIVVAIRCAGINGVTETPGTPSGVTDSAGNTYTLRVSDVTQDPNMFIYSCDNITGGASVTVTAAMPDPDNFAWIAAVEYSGLATSSALDTTDHKTGTGVTDIVGNAITAAQASELVFCAVSQNNVTTYTAGTDFTLIDGAICSAGGIQEYLTSGTLSSYVPHITSGVTNNYTLVTASFKAPAATTNNNFFLFFQ